MRRASARLDIVGRYNTEGVGGGAFQKAKKRAVMLKPNISENRYLSIVWIWGFAPSPHQRASVFDCLFLPPAATTENLFGNLRAKHLVFILEISVLSLTASPLV